jgi:hypothetical protein
VLCSRAWVCGVVLVGVSLFPLNVLALHPSRQVIVAESAPSLDGHRTARELCATRGTVSCTVIADAAVFAMMARVNKVCAARRRAPRAR